MKMTPKQRRAYEGARLEILRAVKRTQGGEPVTSLHLGGSGLVALPPEIGQLTALKWLNLRDNPLTALPPEIGQLTALTELCLDENQLTTLPPEIGQLSNLRELSLIDCGLKSLPPALREMRGLWHLWLHGNPGLNLPPTILGVDPRKGESRTDARSILDYYFGRKAANARPLNEVKVILVGRGGAGKTSTVRALRGMPHNEEEGSTPGIALCDWEMDGCRGKAVTAHIWDFAGQVITHALHQFFFSNSCVYVLVLSGRENNEREDAEYWLRLIKAFGTDAEGHGPPVIVALNKWDMPGCRPRVDRGAMQERYPFIRGFVEIDCKTKKGIPALKKKLCAQVDRLPWVREPFPAEWDAVRKALAGGKGHRGPPHISYAAFRKLCADKGVDDAGEQDSLAEILHRLGIALNYRNDPRLREATVLQPHWLTQNVYAMVRRAEKQAGVLRTADVDAVLKAEKDKEMRAYLVRIMERFEIAYASRSSGAGVWLVPQALPDEQPKGLEVFRDAARATRLSYTYQALPEGLVARAVVRLHEFIEDVKGKKQQWANGAVLVRKGARALLRTEPQDRKVMLTVTGPAKARQQLAGLCQAEMREIHREIEGLDPLEETECEGAWVSTATLLIDETKGKKTGVATRDRGTVQVDPRVPNDAYSVKEARIDKTWKPTVFISYSKSNVPQRKRLESELKVLRNEGLLAAHWHDRMIDPGDEGDETIQRELENADVVIILASTAALATEYITKYEIPNAMKSKARVVPVILESCRWDQSPLGKLNVLPEKGKPLNKWTPRPDGWNSVASGLAKIFKQAMDAAAKENRKGAAPAMGR